MPLIIINTLLGAVFLTVGILSTVLFLKSRAQSSLFLSMSAYGAALWILATLAFINFTNPTLLSLSIKMLHFAGIVIIAGFSCFSYTFLGTSIRNNKKLLFSSLSLFIVFSGLLFFTESVVKNKSVSSSEKIINFGPFYLFYAVYILGAAFVSYYYLIKKSKSTQNKIQKMQLLYVGVGTVTSLSIGLIFNIILPFFGYFTFYWLGPFLSVIFVIFTTFAIFKHNLFNIKVISIELFSALISIFILIDALLAKSVVEFILKTVAFLGVTFIGVLIIKSVLNEIKSREKIAQISEDLRIANIELKRLDQSKSDFLSIASHQLRTPLTAIKGYSSMILEDKRTGLLYFSPS